MKKETIKFILMILLFGIGVGGVFAFLYIVVINGKTIDPTYGIIIVLAMGFSGILASFKE